MKTWTQDMADAFVETVVEFSPEPIQIEYRGAKTICLKTGRANQFLMGEDNYSAQGSINVDLFRDTQVIKGVTYIGARQMGLYDAVSKSKRDRPELRPTVRILPSEEVYQVHDFADDDVSDPCIKLTLHVKR